MVNHPEHGDIYWADLRPAKGSEQDGFRPVFVASNNVMNMYSPVILAVPLTKADKVMEPFQFSYEMKNLNLIKKNVEKLKKDGHRVDSSLKEAYILTQQSRSISKDRLIMKIGRFKTEEYENKIKQAIKFLYATEGCIKCKFPLRSGALKCRNCGTKHFVKCQKCKNVHNYNDKYCPKCGEEAKRNWLR